MTSPSKPTTGQTVTTSIDLNGPPLSVECGNTAELQELAKMRNILDGADYTPTPDGLCGLVEDLDRRIDEVTSARNDLTYIVGVDQDLTLAQLVTSAGEALTDLRNELDALRAVVTEWEATANKMEQAADLFRGTIKILRSEGAELTREQDTLQSEVAALTPGPWLDPAVDPPPIGETILTMGYVPSAVSLCSLSTLDGMRSWLHRWRRIPGALLTPPEVTP